MLITVNGQPTELPSGATVDSVVRLLDVAPDGRGVAVALNGEVVQRARWQLTKLSAGARIEVVAAIQGG